MTTNFGAPSPSSAIQPWTYDVFLSFRGEDTRNTFIGHLLNNLARKGIKTFIDEDGLRTGEEISPALLKAIEESKISVVVFSEKYATSKWCLEELVKILQCKESKQQKVYPIFYKIDPSDVRHQKGLFGEAFSRHQCRFKDNSEKVMRWREALTKAANLSGLHFLDGGHESKFIDAIVEKISTQLLNRTYLNVAKHPVGIESRVEDVLKLLRIGRNDVHIVGIWGTGGIGKTTIAKAVYNSIAHQFEDSCFLANIREESMGSGGLVHLQKNLLSDILGHMHWEFSSVDKGITIIKERMCSKRVLLILDDVNHLNQLNYLVGNPNWFGSGSRIIVTTRDNDCLFRCDVNEIYEVKKLSHHEALALFKFNAFQEHARIDGYDELINNVLLYAQGLPLALEVLGSHLRGGNVDQWKFALDSYKSLPKQEIQKILKISYDALEPCFKELFLHIACFFKGKNKNYVIDVLKGCGLPKIGIKVLTEKALINITEADDIWMHDLLEEMGQEIVFQESPNEPGERSRLWSYEDIHHVFVKNTGTEKVRGIMVKNHKNRMGEKIRLGGKSFLKLTNLQVFIISSDIFTGNHVDYLPNELRLLDWFCCPLLSFPSNFNPKKLVLLKMPGSKTSPLGEVPKILFQVKMPWSCTSPLEKGLEIMPNLKSIDLSNCDGLTKVSDFSRFPNLVDLILTGCENLVELDHSVGFLKNLVTLDLRFCKKLRKLEINNEMKSLKRLELRETAIKALPSSIGYLTNLEELYVQRCCQLTNVPCSILKLQHLKNLSLQQCKKLVTFPTDSAFSTNLWTTSLHDPLYVDLFHCHNLVEISEFPREIDGLFVSGCYRLQKISKLSDILEGKDSKMIPWMDLSYCFLLCSILAYGYKKENYVPDYSEVTALLSLFLSCRQSEFQVVFPALSGVPKWFSSSMESEWAAKEESRICKFKIIEFPTNFKWDNKGLAFYFRSGLRSDRRYRSFGIYINDVGILEEPKFYSRSWVLYNQGFDEHMWLYYVPFDTIIKRLSEGGFQPTFILAVEIHLTYRMVKTLADDDDEPEVVSCGVHVVMPEDEGVFVNGVFHQIEVHQQKPSNLEAHQQKPSNLRRRKGWEAPGY